MPSMVSLAAFASVLVSAASATAQESIGPIGRAITRQAAKLVAADRVVSSNVRGPQRDNSDVQWFHVRMLTRGTDVIVTIRGEQPEKRTFQTATESDMTVVDSQGVPSRLARSTVTEVIALTTRGSVTAAVAFAAIGALVGITIAERLALTVRCQPSCGGVEAAAVLSVVGIPVAAGIGGYHLAKDSTRDVIYRAP